MLLFLRFHLIIIIIIVIACCYGTYSSIHNFQSHRVIHIGRYIHNKNKNQRTTSRDRKIQQFPTDLNKIMGFGIAAFEKNSAGIHEH